MTEARDVVNRYLQAYASGDVDATVASLSPDFAFRGPMQAIEGAEAYRDVVAHVAPHARGHRVLRQWVDGADVCTLYELDVDRGTGPEPVLVAEWSTVSDDRVASSLMVFDTGRFQRAARSGDAVDPICGMTVDPARAAAHRRHDDRDFHFCSVGCAERFDDDPARYAAARG